MKGWEKGLYIHTLDSRLGHSILQACADNLFIMAISYRMCEGVVDGCGEKLITLKRFGGIKWNAIIEKGLTY